MSERKEEFDLHIKIDSYSDDDDGWSSATVKVTFPPYASQPAMTQEYVGDDEYQVLGKATKDIGKFLDEPDAWVKAFVEQSKDTGRKLAYAKEQVAKYTSQAELYQRNADQSWGYAVRYVQEIEKLEQSRE